MITILLPHFNANNIDYKEPYGGPVILFDVWLRNKPADILLQAVSNGESRLFRFPVDSTESSPKNSSDYKCILIVKIGRNEKDKIHREPDRWHPQRTGTGQKSRGHMP